MYILYILLIVISLWFDNYYLNDIFFYAIERSSLKYIWITVSSSLIFFFLINIINK